jgi:hypothetical protein
VDKTAEVFLPNLATTHVLNIWGAQDVNGPDLKTRSPTGGIATENRMLKRMAADLKLPIQSYEDAAHGHTDVDVPAELVLKALEHKRAPYPPQVQQTCRDLQQARAYWLEGLEWRGKRLEQGSLGALELSPKDANDPAKQKEALQRAIRGRLGELKGTIDGRTIDVRRRNVGELVIWVGDGMIDWDQPVVVKVSGSKVFEGKLTPDLGMCLAQAARTYDFERLRWAGIRYKPGSKARGVTAAELTSP